MIRLEHITKYYNKNKVNQFIVCNDISLTFDNTGLVVVLGASGSGKTTLLNVISGMDKFDQGRLIFDDLIFDRYSHKKWDFIRKHRIGYVYQNYHLLKKLSVYENIEPVLKMQGITDETQIREHILRLLDSVGLANYENRLVKQLSGGEQQRVAFARALANNPKVILADEPTGNLDGKTTIELMNVIKEISKTRLVIMVTHEQALCDYYADRVIKIENGSIVNDYGNDQRLPLDFIQEHIINLSDFEKTTLNTEQLNVSRYSNIDSQDVLDIDLIERNQTLYVKINSNSLKRTKYIDSDSEIIIQDSPETSTVDQNPFILDDMYPADFDQSKEKVFRWKDVFRFAWRKLNIIQGGNRILFVVLMLVGIIVSISIGLLGEIYRVEEPYQPVDLNYITVYLDRLEYDEYELILDVPGVDQLMLVNKPFTFHISTTDYYQVRSSILVDAQPIDIKFFDETTLIYGSMPTSYQIVVDQSVANDIIENNQSRGIQTYDDVLNCQFKLQTNSTDTYINADTAVYFNISGIANGNSKSVWMKEELIYSLVTPYLIDYRVLEDQFEIVSGELPTSESYLMLNENYPGVFAGDIPYNIGIATGTYYVSGIYRYSVDGVSYNFKNAMVSTLEFMKPKYFKTTYPRYTDFTLLVYATDINATLLALDEAGYEATGTVYIPEYTLQSQLQENQIYYLLGLGGIFVSAFSIFLIMRSSLLSRIYEVSVYRGIGISRREIRRIFLVEILLTTTFSSVIGFLLMVLLLNQAQSTLELISVTHFTGLTILLTVVGMYVVNIIFGLIPINMLLRKTPSTIMKQSDL